MVRKIAICDDNSKDSEYVSSLVKKWFNDKKLLVKIDTFNSAESFLFQYAQDKSYDILLLDIEMGKMDGVTMAKEIRKENKTVQIIFITGYSDYIAEGYEVAALHYLMKPVNENKLYEVLNRACEKINQNEKNLSLMIYGEMVLVPLHKIKYITVLKNYITIFAWREYTVKKTLGEIEKNLDERFIRVGRSLIINITCISRVTKSDVYLLDGSVLPLPRGAYEVINRAIITLS